MAPVTFNQVTRRFSEGTKPAVSDLSIEVGDGELLVLVGPSGCGKSTSLRMLAGLEPVDDGQIWIGDKDVTDLPPKARDIAMVFQSYALYPHMTVGENMGFALKIARHQKSEIARRVASAADMLGLQDFLDRRPKDLSGGQRQRVAMGRAIVRSPQVFLMDEPLSNLDAKLRVQTRGQIAKLQRDLGTTTVFVTHDQVEAMTLGDRVAVMKDGELQQCDSPRSTYDRPINVFVAGFLGSPAMNLIEGVIDGAGSVEIGGLSLPLPRSIVAETTSNAITVGLRPEALSLSEGGGIAVVVDSVEELGSDAYMYGHLENNPTQLLTVRVDWRTPPQPGTVVRISADHTQAHLFSAETGERLSP